MVSISRKAYERNGVKTIAGTVKIIWLNNKHIAKRLDHKNPTIITRKYP